MDVVSAFGAPEVAMRLVAATIAGCVLGINRDLHDKPAGLRTHALVSLGAALLTLATLELSMASGEINQDTVSRVVQGIVAGIGFLGGGVILRDEQSHNVQGLTTAATIWLTAGLGIACGMGAWNLVMMTGGLTLAVLVLGGPLEDAIRRLRKKGEPPPS